MPETITILEHHFIWMVGLSGAVFILACWGFCILYKMRYFCNHKWISLGYFVQYLSPKSAEKYQTKGYYELFQCVKCKAIKRDPE